MLCNYCNKECKNKNSKRQHEIRCSANSNRISNLGLKWSDEQKENFSKKCIITKCNQSQWSTVRRQQASIASKLHNETFWTQEQRDKHSIKMKQVVANSPESYSTNNVSGRTKMYDILSSTGPTKVKGRWELMVASWLNENNIAWTNNIIPYDYTWNNRLHRYFPDFLLLDHNIIVEVKGYQTDRDLEKWKSVVDRKFVVITKHNLNKLDEAIFLNAGNANGEQEGS